MLAKWMNKNPSMVISEQVLAGQVNSVLKREVFSDVEIDELHQVLGLMSSAVSASLEVGDDDVVLYHLLTMRCSVKKCCGGREL